MDLASRPIAPAELRRFAARFGASSLVDDQSRIYRDAGLAYLRLDDDELFQRVLNDQRLVRLPLVRVGQNVSIGVDEGAWKGWLTEA